MVDLKNEEGSCDVKIWEWLLQLIQYLGADGMSSEESGVEVNDEGIAQKVYRVKIMPWRRNINQELAIIDKARLQDKDLYSEAGAKPVPRKRSEQNEASSRQPVCDLPRSFYDDSWFDRLNANFRDCTLRVSKKQFHWFEHVAAQG
jgi:hypothetical protein